MPSHVDGPSGGAESPGELTLAHLAAAALLLVRARLRSWCRLPRPARRLPLRVWVSCAGAVAVISLLTAGLSWLVWQELQRERAVAGGRAAEQARELTRELEADPPLRTLTRELEVTDGRAGRAVAGPAEGDGRGAASGPGGVDLPDQLVAAAAVCLIVLTGVASGALVVRRLSRTSGSGSPGDEPDVDSVDAVPAVTDDVGEQADEPDAVDEPEGEGGIEAVSAAVDGPMADAEEQQPVGREAVAAGAERPALSGYAELGRSFIPGQRIYERRRAPRVAVSIEGRLQWKGGEWPIRVLDLSEGGLRCHVDESGPVRQRLPVARDHVRVAVVLGGRIVSVTGQVAWRRFTTGSTELGVQFGSMPEDDLSRIRQLCFAVAAAGAD